MAYEHGDWRDQVSVFVQVGSSRPRAGGSPARSRARSRLLPARAGAVTNGYVARAASALWRGVGAESEEQFVALDPLLGLAGCRSAAGEPGLEQGV